MAIAQTVEDFLAKHAIEYKLVAHSHTGSSHETAEAAHVSEDHIAKAVIVKESGNYAMVVVPANNWVEVEHLRKELNRDFHLAAEDELKALFPDCETGRRATVRACVRHRDVPGSGADQPGQCLFRGW